MDTKINLRVEFGGGLELLFSNKRVHDIRVPCKVSVDNSTKEHRHSSKDVDLEFLIFYLRDTLLTERPELFVDKNTV